MDNDRSGDVMVLAETYGKRSSMSADIGILSNIRYGPKADVLDPFAGSGTTLVGALMSARPAVGIELNDNYCARIKDAFSSRKHVVDGDYTRTSSKGKIAPRKKTSSTHGSRRSRDDLRAHK
jgi:DNA methylase